MAHHFKGGCVFRGYVKLKIPPALKNKRFALLWAGMLISFAGSQMQVWALLWHMRTLTDKPAAVSGIGLARFLPILIFALIAGLISDLYNRRKILFITQTVMTLGAVALGVLTQLGIIQIWHIYILTAIQAVAVSFDGPARQALIPNLVAKEDLPSAFSLNSIAANTGAIIGPALSGIVISLYGQDMTYYLNAISFIAVLIALVLIGPVTQEVKPEVRARGINLPAIQEGIHFIFKRPIILSSMILDFFATFFSSANTLLPFVARDILKVGVTQYGWLSAAQSIGAVAAALVISQRANLRRQGALLLGSVVIFGIATILFGVTRVFWLTMLALILVGAADSVSTILRNTIRQLQTPDYIRGRMVSINQIFFMGGPQLGEIEAGLVAQAFSVPAAIITGGIGCIVAVAVIARRWPSLRRYNGDEPILAGADL
jgi:MFS family permease